MLYIFYELSNISQIILSLIIPINIPKLEVKLIDYIDIFKKFHKVNLSRFIYILFIWK